jgi:hypothetical protein
MFVVVSEIFDQLLPRCELHLLLCCEYCLHGGGADTLKFNLHIIGCAKKGCEFNQKRCEFKFSKLIIIYLCLD